MSKIITKVGNFIFENLFLQQSTDETQIKRKIKSNLEGVVLVLIFIVINFIVSCVPEVIPFSIDFDLLGGGLSVIALLKAFCALYYINKL